MENARAAGQALLREKFPAADGGRTAPMQWREIERQLAAREELAALREICVQSETTLTTARENAAAQYDALRQILRRAGVADQSDLPLMARQYQTARQSFARRETLLNETLPALREKLAALPDGEILARDAQTLAARRDELLEK
jgi:hypothetical protein